MAKRRRFHYDNLAPVNGPRWLKVYNRLSEEISSQRLEAGTDLRAAMRAAAQQLVAEGWVIEGDGPENWTGSFFANRLGERRHVSVAQIDAPGPMHSIPRGCWSPGWTEAEEVRRDSGPPPSGS